MSDEISVSHSGDVEQSYLQVQNKFGFRPRPILRSAPLFKYRLPRLYRRVDRINAKLFGQYNDTDSVFATKRLTVDSSADKVDSNNWGEMRGVALTPQKRKPIPISIAS